MTNEPTTMTIGTGLAMTRRHLRKTWEAWHAGRGHSGNYSECERGGCRRLRQAMQAIPTTDGLIESEHMRRTTTADRRAATRGE